MNPQTAEYSKSFERRHVTVGKRKAGFLYKTTKYIVTLQHGNGITVKSVNYKLKKKQQQQQQQNK